MRKVTFIVSVIALQMLFLTQVANANYTIHNGSKHKVLLIVSTWMESEKDIPAGYRTIGYYKVAPGNFFTIDWSSSDYYIRMEKLMDGFSELIKPSDSATRNTYTFKIEPKNAFTVVEKAHGEILYGSGGIENLVKIGGFYKYKNGGTFNINGDNLEAAKLARVNSELKERERNLAEINQQLARLTSTVIQVGSAGYMVLNGSTEKVYLTVSTWMKSMEDIPAGYRTQGYYKIDPGSFFTIGWGSSDYYIRMHKWVNGTKHLIKPSDSASRKSYTLWIEPKNRFSIVEDSHGKILYSSDDIENLTRAEGFYKLGNTGTFKILGPNIELAEKEFKLAEVNLELQVKRYELAKHIGQFNKIGSQEVHALLILLGNDKHIRTSVEQNESHMKKLLRQVSQYATVHLTVMTSEDEVTGNVTTMKLSAGNTSNIKSLPQGLIKGYQVNDWFNNLRAGQHDTILIYYNGHGEMRGTDDKHVLRFDQQTGDGILRSRLRTLLAQKPGRLKMLITDTCSNRASTPALVAKNVNFASVRQRSKTYTKNLFLQHEGILDITAVKPGHYAWGSTDIGGYFTVGLLQSFTAESDVNQDRFLTWEEVFKNAQVRTNKLFKQANFQQIDKLKMKRARQKGQEPFKHSLPTPVE